jgi:glycosyltransferase involved in cell wall biosynthesis
MPPRRVRVVGRGVDTSSFSPSYRDDALRARWGIRYPHKLLYVGRISQEKNLGCLVQAFKRLCRHRHDLCLVVVGEGPYQERMAQELSGLPVVFTGLQLGRDLSRLYASCDLFVFPSETDTFGVVVIEAQASGLPVIVSSSGGSQDLVRSGENGRVVTRITPNRLADVIEETLDDPDGLARMRQSALQYAATLTPSTVFDAFWKMHRDVHAEYTLGERASIAPSPPVPAGDLREGALAQTM